MRGLPRWLVVVFLIGAAVVLLRLFVFRPRPIAVEVNATQVGEVEETVTNTRAGTVKARLRAKLSPQIGGRVVQLPCRKGSRVETGSLLLKLDDSLQQAQLRLAQEDVRLADARAEEACLAAALAEKEWKRGLALRRDSIASEQMLDALESSRDQARAACAAAQAGREQAGARVQLARAELAFTEVRAPFAGVLAELSTEVGEWITPAPPGVPIPPVLDLIDPSSVYISAPIDEVDGGRVREGQEVRIQIDSRPGEHFFGKLVRVAPYVLDVLEQNRTVEVEAEFADSAVARSVLAGTSADVEVILTRLSQVLRIPTAAVAGGDKVLVLAGGTLVERKLATGLRNWQFTQVLSGLQAGDLVVTSRESTAMAAGVRAVARKGG